MQEFGYIQRPKVRPTAAAYAPSEASSDEEPPPDRLAAIENKLDLLIALVETLTDLGEPVAPDTADEVKDVEEPVDDQEAEVAEEKEEEQTYNLTQRQRAELQSLLENVAEPDSADEETEENQPTVET